MRKVRHTLWYSIYVKWNVDKNVDKKCLNIHRIFLVDTSKLLAAVALRIFSRNEATFTMYVHHFSNKIKSI